MDLPSFLFSQNLKIRHIYFFRSVPPGNGVAKHMHICITRRDGKKLFFVVCTTQYNTIINFINKRGFDNSTAVGIARDAFNNFDEEYTYINCNNVFECTEIEFNDAYDKGEIDYIGEVSESAYSQIIHGICNSPMVEGEIKDLLKEG